MKKILTGKLGTEKSDRKIDDRKIGQKSKNLLSAFICVHLRLNSSNDSNLRNGDNEFAAFFAIGLLLIEDFVGEIPSQQQRVIGHFLEELGGRDDRDMRAGSRASLFVSAAVRDKIESLFSEAKEIQQRASFGRRAVSGNRFSIALQLLQEAYQGTFQFQHT